MKRIVISVLFLLVVTSIIYVVWYFFEGSPPVVDAQLPSRYLKKNYEMSIAVSDRKTGLRSIMVSVVQKDKETILLEKQYESPGLSGLFSTAKTLTDSLVVPIEASKYGMTDGEVVIRIMVSDYSWRGWGKGNVFFTEKQVILDSKPPEVAILTDQHNIERGGTGLVIYKVFEENVKTGISVGDNFFPGFPGLFENPHIHACFFALSHLQGPGTKIFLVAEDMAGNLTKRSFFHYIRDKKFKTDTLGISDTFLEQIMPDFDLGVKESAFQDQENPLLKKFLYINKDLRKENEDQILNASSASQNIKHWDGVFLALERAQKKAGFADHRSYQYKGDKIDTSVHLGIDLASIASSPVPAANAGKVVLTGFVGIYGNSVVIDHGFGLGSLYSHLSQITVNEGDILEKGAQVGFTGMTGMAAGDHLHFSMMVHNVFVTPLEWWDSAWINNNITAKIEAVKQRPDI